MYTTRYVLRIALAIFCTALGATAAAQEHHHPPHEADAHEEFYRHLSRPDWPEPRPGSCCSGSDCYVTAAKTNAAGTWFALRREDKVWIEIPANRIVTRPDELKRRVTYQATLCATTYFTYCFVAPEPGI